MRYLRSPTLTTLMGLQLTTAFPLTRLSDLPHLFRFPMLSGKMITRGIDACCKACCMYEHISRDIRAFLGRCHGAICMLTRQCSLALLLLAHEPLLCWVTDDALRSVAWRLLDLAHRILPRATKDTPRSHCRCMLIGPRSIEHSAV